MDDIKSYEAIGGEAAVRLLCNRFYYYMAILPEVKVIRDMHPADLSSSEEKLFMFLSGWLGGPQLFVEKFGHPRLRARHLPFKIGPSEFVQWMMCMHKAMDDLDPPEPMKTELMKAIGRLAHHMQNQAE
ncbi:MAG: group II truncated hemoglobin [Pseudobdellovibrionaceae bacterium]